jgi:hypothetical protein
MLPYLYNHLVYYLGVNMAFEIKAFIRGSSSCSNEDKFICYNSETDINEDDVLRIKNRWRKYSL